MIASKMFCHVLVLLCFAHQWTFSYGHKTDRLPSVSAQKKSIKSNHVEVVRPCKKKDSCSCVRSDGTGIDLHQLDTGPKPRFTTNADVGIMQWNPCTGFEAGGVEGVAVSYGANKQVLFPAGLQYTAKFSKLPNNTDVIDYTSSSSWYGSSRIMLLCNEKIKPSFTFTSAVGNLLVGAYHGPCYQKSKAGISIGSIILITFCAILIVYFVVGLAVNVYVRKLEGFERIPNYSFWSTVFGLIKDGVVFTFRRKGRKSEYGEI